MDEAARLRPDRVLAASVLKEQAQRHGFVRAGISAAERPPRFEQLRDWIAGGHQAGMSYLARTLAIRENPETLLPGGRSILCLAYPHPLSPPVAADGSRVARYASGPDYHFTLRMLAKRVIEDATTRLGPFRHRICVDSTPVAERSLAAAAGLGWIGKNGCLIDPEHGSFLLLAEILTDLDAASDEPIAERCGSCVRCLEACPTQAFLAPGLLDAARCLSYWTIEHRGAIPDRIKERMGEHVFGCDICQEVCPWNSPRESTPTLASGQAPAALPTRADWLAMGKGEWRRRFGATALNRAGRRGLQRNAAASAGASGDRSAGALLPTVSACRDAGLADAARWALARVAQPTR